VQPGWRSLGRGETDWAKPLQAPGLRGRCGRWASRGFASALESATQAELPLLKRFNTVFQSIIAVSPLLGLLGTILGLIRSFAAIQIGEIGANAELVTGGISEALVSTAAGLVVAIFTLLFANLFRGLYRRQVALLQEYGSQLEILYEWHHAALKQGNAAYARH
ncbi:MAG: MotA/TolQ/ExbB proton channel family protein, partial [Leptolyngbya sp. SIO4C5]|nr:MotA/TolQ/ExbB proton channel family protein [Leptolyngbya sp. SIO4C5]